MQKIRMMLATTVAACALAGAAQAATISVAGVYGKWIEVTGGVSVSGVGTDSISWGTDIGNGQSGYDFVALAPSGPWNPDQVFDLGTFVHRNQPIGSGSSITQAKLEVEFGFTIDADPMVMVRKSTFVFNHWETPNGNNPCADGGANGVGVNDNGCADNVSPVTNAGFTESFFVDGMELVLDVTGFDIGPSFWTREGADNAATIQARFTEKSNIAPVPLPAAGLLLLSALAGAGALSRRRKAA